MTSLMTAKSFLSTLPSVYGCVQLVLLMATAEFFADRQRVLWCYREYRGGKFCDCHQTTKFSNVEIEILNRKVYSELVSVYSCYLIDDHFHL